MLLRDVGDRLEELRACARTRTGNKGTAFLAYGWLVKHGRPLEPVPIPGVAEPLTHEPS